MSDGDDDQPPQDERQRELSVSRERVHLRAQVPQEPQIQLMVTPEPADKPDEDSNRCESLIYISWTTTIS